MKQKEKYTSNEVEVKEQFLVTKDNGELWGCVVAEWSKALL